MKVSGVENQPGKSNDAVINISHPIVTRKEEARVEDKPGKYNFGLFLWLKHG